MLFACTNDDEPVIVPSQDSELNRPKSRSMASDLTTDEALESFAKILSKAVYNHHEVRELLKTEASKYFDKNSDVLYVLIKNTYIEGRTFRSILLDYTTEHTLSEIEETVPLLNILIPQIPLFDITPENMDCNDAEIPVALCSENGMSLYINGVEETCIGPGALPDFHTFVVNENSRVKAVVEPTSRGDANSVVFISPNYNGMNNNIMLSSAENNYDISCVGTKAFIAFGYFNRNEPNEYSISLQRDYIYYNMTPTSEKATSTIIPMSIF